MSAPEYGPTLKFSRDEHARKYRQEGETFRERMTGVADGLKDSDPHFHSFRDPLLHQRFLPPGRVQAAVGSTRYHTPYNCFVSGTIPDSLSGITDKLGEAAQTMKLGGGIGYDFSTLRPRNDWIASQETSSSGAVSFAQPFDAMCKTIASAGNRRGAQMLGLRVDHPDIEEFVHAKVGDTSFLSQFNISVLVTDEFMQAVLRGESFPLRFGGRVYKWVDAQRLWHEIMCATWDWAEPGVLFIDRANEMNNLWYCEHLPVTNPCGEQWLPPYGACLLGAFNLPKYLYPWADTWIFDWQLFEADIEAVYPAMDNVPDRATFPLDAQREEAQNKRRMGLGITGLANAGEAMGMPYGSQEFLVWHDRVEWFLTNKLYELSALRAAEYGPFPAFDREKFLNSKFVQRLDPYVQDLIWRHGIRNSHLRSQAPTGTTSLCADNVSSGIEPVFSLGQSRKVRRRDDEGFVRIEEEGLVDYGWNFLGVEGKTVANGDVSVEDHLNVLEVAAYWNDSSVSKTTNISDDTTFEEFKNVYFEAWRRGAKGCTTFRPAGKRWGILQSSDDSGDSGSSEEASGGACTFDPETGVKSCDE